MNMEIMNKAAQIADKAGYVFVATFNAAGAPHVAIAGRMTLNKRRRVEVTEWFCPGTVANLQENPRLSLVAWDSTTDTGYQLIGELEEIKDIAMLDGYTRQMESMTVVPQVERQLLIHIDRVIDFKRAPHTDIEE